MMAREKFAKVIADHHDSHNCAARKMSISRPTVSGIISGRTPISIRMAFAMQTIYRVSARDLLTKQLEEQIDAYEVSADA